MAYSDFKGSFEEMARSNRFRLTVSGLLSQPLLVKASSLPGSNIPAVEVFHEGLAVKLAGDRTYDDWDVTCWIDKKATLYKDVMKWADLANGSGAQVNVGAANKNTYKQDVGIVMLDRIGTVIQGTEYKMLGAYPSAIAPVDLAHDSNDTAAEFTITFSYDYYEVK